MCRRRRPEIRVDQPFVTTERSDTGNPYGQPSVGIIGECCTFRDDTPTDQARVDASLDLDRQTLRVSAAGTRLY
jgi:hypothetical protein